MFNLNNHIQPKAYPVSWTENYFQQDDRDLKSVAAKSTIWLFSQKFAERMIRLLFTAVLARLLTPADFGLLGTASVFLGIAGTLGNFGFGTAIVQKKEVSRVYLSTAFWFNSLLGILLCLLCIAGSPLASAYFKDDAVKNVIILMSFSFIFQGVSNVHQSILSKQLQFDKMAKYTFFGTLFSRFVIVFYALVIQLNYWALVIGELSTNAVAMFFRYYYTRWRPYLVFNKEAFKDMFNFGKNIFFHGILNYFAANVDYIIVGRQLGVDILGIYLFAYTVPHVILREFSMILMQILFPLLSSIKDDKERFKRGYLKSISLVSMVSFPVCMGMMVTGNHFLLVLYGQKWEAAIVPFKILCFSGMAKSILTSMGVIYKSKGRPDIELKWNIIFFPVIVVSVYVGSYYGLVGVAVGMTVTSYLHFVTLWRALHLAEISIRSFLGALKISMTGTGLMVLCVYSFNALYLSRYDFSHILSLSILTAVGVTVYCGYLLLFGRENLFELMDMVKKGLSKT